LANASNAFDPVLEVRAGVASDCARVGIDAAAKHITISIADTATTAPAARAEPDPRIYPLSKISLKRILKTTEKESRCPSV